MQRTRLGSVDACGAIKHPRRGAGWGVRGGQSGGVGGIVVFWNFNESFLRNSSVRSF